MTLRRVLLTSVVTVVAIVVVSGAVIAWRIGPRNIIGMLRYDTRQEGSLVVGDRAPDVAFAKLDGSGDAQLSDFLGDKPLVIVFGSFT